MRVFLDTNILLDVLLNREEFIADSNAVILQGETGSLRQDKQTERKLKHVNQTKLKKNSEKEPAA